MPSLTPEQRNRILEVVREYFAAPAGPSGKTPFEAQSELDRNRIELIDREIKPLVDGYLTDRVALPDFKSRIDGINKRNEFWGFKGIKGQMFFNMLVNVSPDEGECVQELKAAIAVPTNEEICSAPLKLDHQTTFLIDTL